MNEQQNDKDEKTNDVAQLDTQASEGHDCDGKCSEYLEGWRRAQADYANLKKDFEKAKQEFSDYANENLLYELLPAIDQFEIALNFIPETSGLPETEKKQMENWLVGIKAVKQMWEQTFTNIGLECVDTAGAFDPEKHNAVGKEEDKDKPPNTILKVIQPGWALKGRVLRPAKVIVNSISN